MIQFVKLVFISNIYFDYYQLSRVNEIILEDVALVENGIESKFVDDKIIEVVDGVFLEVGEDAVCVVDSDLDNRKLFEFFILEFLVMQDIFLFDDDDKKENGIDDEGQFTLLGILLRYGNLDE